jgi:2-amino-4-hydroxy-6-hydroxymethyldihydropteridine diphosphokinase
VRYWVGLGANLGDRLRTLQAAAAALSALGTRPAASSVYDTSPVGGPPQPPFLNAALRLEVEREPLEMLRACRAIEAALGRDRALEPDRFGPRPIDLDLLLAGARGELSLTTAELALPHPRLHLRAFALAPLVELDPTLVHPLLGQPLSELLRAARDHGQALVPTDHRLW